MSATIAAVSALLAHASPVANGWQLAHWICKPLATILAIALAWRVRSPVSAAYRAWMLRALVLCLIGDVLLMLGAALFVPGLVAFLCAHVCLIAAFIGDKPWRARPLPWLACLLVGGFEAWHLWPHLSGALRIAVPLYVAVLATMAGQALGRALWRGTADARLAGLGAACFMASDAMLAWAQFVRPFVAAPLAVLASYYLALWLLACSVARPVRVAADEEVRA